MITVYLVRHGETVYNAQDRIQGQRDVELSDLGRCQARAVAERLARERITAVYSSDLSRALETAEEIARPHNLTVTPTPELRERSLGVLEGLTLREAESRYPARLHSWRRDKSMAPPGGETTGQVLSRCAGFARRILAEHGDSDAVVVVGHVGSVRGVIKALCPRLPEDRLRTSNGSVSILEVGDQCRAVSLDDTSHLDHTQITRGGADDIGC